MEDGKPFFIQLSWHALHSPQNALKATLEKYETAGIQRGKQAQRAPITEDLDTGVGRILESLERLGLAENTYVIYTSDNGGGGGGRRGVLSSGKGSLWEGGIRVPFIVRGPGITPESWCHVPIVGYDLFPTYLEWAGVDVLPDELKLRLDGASIAHLLANEGDGAITRQRDGLVFHFPHYQSGDGPHSALLLGNFKLIKFYETGRLSLFDLAADAGERNDLSQSLPEKTAEMATLLDRHLSEIGAQMPTINPDYDPSQPTATQHDGRSAKRSDR